MKDSLFYLSIYDSISHVHCVDIQLQNINITNWVYTEDYIEKNCFDVHFSFFNLKLNSWIISVYDALNDTDIFIALTFEDGISGSTAALFDRASMKGPDLQNNKEIKAAKQK